MKVQTKTCLFFAFLFTVIGVSSFWFHTYAWIKFQPNNSLHIGTDRGSVYINLANNFPFPSESSSCSINAEKINPRLGQLFFTLGSINHLAYGGGIWHISFPFWQPVLLALIFGFLPFLHRIPSGFCFCGYNVRDLAVCPECGKNQNRL